MPGLLARIRRRLSRLGAVAAFLALTAVASAADAALVYATGSTTLTSVFDLDGDQSISGTGNLAGAPDGASVLVRGIDGIFFESFRLTMAFAPGRTNGSFQLFTGSTAGGAWGGFNLALSRVTWSGGTAPGTTTSMVISGGALGASSTYTISSIPWSDDFTSVTLTFNASGLSVNRSASFDAIAANTLPEPGTWALFGTGVVALATSVLRRRSLRRRVAA